MLYDITITNLDETVVKFNRALEPEVDLGVLTIMYVENGEVINRSFLLSTLKSYTYKPNKTAVNLEERRQSNFKSWSAVIWGIWLTICGMWLFSVADSPFETFLVLIVISVLTFIPIGLQAILNTIYED